MAEYLVGTEKVGGYAYCKYCIKTLTIKELYDIIQKTRQPIESYPIHYPLKIEVSGDLFYIRGHYSRLEFIEQLWLEYGLTAIYNYVYYTYLHLIPEYASADHGATLIPVTVCKRADCL